MDKQLQQAPKYLWFLILSFSMILAISNWYDARLIRIFTLNLTPGSLFFPATFLLSNIITEVYGYKNARKAILASMLFNLIFILFGKLITQLPSPSFTNNAEIDNIISMDFWIIVASFSSYITAEPLNSYLVAKLKIMTDGKYMGLRFIASTIIASSIDTPIFVFIAFHKTLDFTSMLSLIFPVWLVKCLVEILLLPVSIRITKRIKNREKMNIFDFNTNFNPFILDSKYSINENKV